MSKDDIISQLPDEILHQILSAVDIKLAVRTTVLSKRWRRLCYTLPNLTFDYGGLLRQSAMNVCWTTQNPSFMSHFRGLVTAFLSRRDPSSSAVNFHLKSNQMSTDSKFVLNCILHDIDHGVRHLAVDAFCSPAPLVLPDRLFASETLRVLSIKQYTKAVVVPKPFVIPKLKRLVLDSFNFDNDGGGGGDIHSFSIDPLSDFPNLEELSLHNCEISGLVIRSPRLRVLEISSSGPFFSRKVEIEEISAPALVSFRYEGYYSLVCKKTDLPRLEEVYFNLFQHLEAPYTDEIKEVMPLNLVATLNQLRNAKIVTLTFDTLEVLEDPRVLEQSLTPFPNLKLLKLKGNPWSLCKPVMEMVPESVMDYLTKGGDSPVVKFL